MFEEMSNPDALRDPPVRQANNPNVDGDGETELEPEWDDLGEVGALMEASDEEVPQMLKKMRERYDQFLHPLRVQWRVNALRRRGVSHIRPQLDEDGRWFVWKSPAVRSTESVFQLNPAADLCRKLAALLFADPPAPDVVPPSGDDADEERAITATRVLEELQGEGELRTPARVRRAFDRASSYASAFLAYSVDPTGGRRLPIRLEAGYDPVTGEEATSEADALDNPMTGQPWPAFRLRYLAPDGSLTEDEKLAARRFSPRLRSRILTGNNVYIFPHDSEWVGDADAVLLVEYVTVGAARRESPELEEVLRDKEKRAQLLGARTDYDEDILGPGRRKRDLDEREGDEALVLRVEYFHRQSAAYAEGAHIVVYGDRFVAIREPWVTEIRGREVARMIPVTQIAQLSEGRPGPYGVAAMEVLGPGNEIHALAFSTYLEVLERTRNRKTFIPTIQPLGPAAFNNPNHRYLPIAPGTEPRTEDVPQLPAIVQEVFHTVSRVLENKISLGQTAQGLEAKTVQSGRHAWAIVQQVHAQMSELVENIELGYRRACRIELQTVACEYTLEQTLSYRGEGGEWVTETWQGADFAGTTDVRLKPGTMSMMTPEQKEQQAIGYAQLGIYRPHELRDLIRSNVGGRVGIEDDPHLERVRGQVARWRKGPPEGWQPPQPPMEPQFINGIPTGHMIPVVVNGQPLPADPDPLLQSIFMPSPADTLPEIAQMRLFELAKAAASRFYFETHPEWRSALDMEIQKMQHALAPSPPAPGQPAGAVAPQEQGVIQEAPDPPANRPPSAAAVEQAQRIV